MLSYRAALSFSSNIVQESGTSPMVRIQITIVLSLTPSSRLPSRSNHSKQNPAEQFEADLCVICLWLRRILWSDIWRLSPDVWEQFLFHYISEDGLTFMVMADDSVGRRLPFAFLAELQRQVLIHSSTFCIHF